MSETTAQIADGLPGVSSEQVVELVSRTCPVEAYRGKRILLIVPDGTRTAPVGLLFKALHTQVGAVTKAFDVLIALGTHQPMTEAAICRRLEILDTERQQAYRSVNFFNHEWNNPEALKQIGTLTGDEVSKLTDGLFSMEVPVEINRMLFNYDQIVIVGPVFPHEVVGFSGGNKYLFPGSRRATDSELFSLARRSRHQPDDHREQMDPRAPSRGSGGRNGQRGQTLFLHGGRSPKESSWPFRRRARNGMGRGERAFEESSYYLQRQTVPHHSIMRTSHV